MFDNESFERIVREFSTPLYRYCYARTDHNKELSEEILNDIFEVLFTKWDTLTVGENIRAYLHRVADHCIRRSLERYRSYYNNVESYEKLNEEKGFSIEGREDSYFASREEEQLAMLYDSLEKEDKLLFKYRYLERLTLTEITERAAIPYSTLRYRLIKLDKTVREKVSLIFANSNI